MLPDKMALHCIVFMNSWDVSGAFWSSFSKCNMKYHLSHSYTYPLTPLTAVGVLLLVLLRYDAATTWQLAPVRCQLAPLRPSAEGFHRQHSSLP